MPQFDFSTNDYTGNFGERRALEEGKYKVVISGSERRETRSGNGAYLLLVFTVIEGPCEGSKVFTNLNLWNASSAAVRMAREELTAIARACGVDNPQASEQLHNLPLYVDVIQETSGPDSKLRNRITAYYGIRRAPAAAPQTPAGNDPAPYKRAATGSGWGN